jgi:hypothetical protein
MSAVGKISSTWSCVCFTVAIDSRISTDDCRTAGGGDPIHHGLKRRIEHSRRPVRVAHRNNNHVITTLLSQTYRQLRSLELPQAGPAVCVKHHLVNVHNESQAWLMSTSSYPKSWLGWVCCRGCEVVREKKKNGKPLECVQDNEHGPDNAAGEDEVIRKRSLHLPSRKFRGS